MQTERFTFVGTDWKKVGIGALVAVVGALLTYGSEWLVKADFGNYTPIVMAGWSVVANIARKWISNQS